MKKILLFVATLAMVSCSDNDNSGTGSSTDATLLTSMSQTQGDGTQTTATYRYNDNQLIEISNPVVNQKTILTYNANFPTEINTYRGNELTQKTVIQYTSSGQLAQQVIYRYLMGETTDIFKFTYTFSAENVTIGTYEVSGGSDVFTGNIVYTLAANGNIMSKVTDANNGTTYTYDGNKSPFSDIAGAQVLRLIFLDGGPNNILTTRIVSGGTVTNTYSTYTYNSDGFPLTENYTTASGEVIARRYNYN
jgi:hypothetical protein